MLKSNYSFLDKAWLAYCLIRTKIICYKAKLFCRPLDLRGVKYVDFGKGLSMGVGCRIEAFDNGSVEKTLTFGDNVQLNDYVHIVAMESVSIGSNVLMASHIFISDNSHGSYKGDDNDSDPRIAPIKRAYPAMPISIGKNTWVCEGVMIMPGAIIGQGCIIGAHSIVRGVIPDYCIAAGNPAKIIKRYNFKTKHWERV